MLLVPVAAWMPPRGEASAYVPGALPHVAVSQATPMPPANFAPVVLKWTTKSEVNTAGFNIYRSVAADGPYTLINRDLIPASNDAIAGGQYQFTDTTAVAGITYFYQLEDVETNGTRTRHAPFRIVVGASENTGFNSAATVLVAVAAAGMAGVIAWCIRARQN